MKTLSNILISHAIFLLLFAGAAMVLAQESEQTDLATSTETQGQDRATENRELRENRQVEREAIRSDRKITLETRVQTRVTNLIANMSNRIDAATARLQNITDRLDSRIDKLSATGVDTADAESALALAQSSIAKSIATMEGIDLMVREVVTSDDFISGWRDIRAVLTETKVHLQTAKTELQATVVELKEAIERPTESSVDETSNTELEEAN